MKNKKRFVSFGVMALVLGIVTVVFGIAVGVLGIVNGSRLLEMISRMNEIDE